MTGSRSDPEYRQRFHQAIGKGGCGCDACNKARARCDCTRCRTVNRTTWAKADLYTTLADIAEKSASPVERLGAYAAMRRLIG